MQHCFVPFSGISMLLPGSFAKGTETLNFLWSGSDIKEERREPFKMAGRLRGKEVIKISFTFLPKVRKVFEKQPSALTITGNDRENGGTLLLPVLFCSDITLPGSSLSQPQRPWETRRDLWMWIFQYWRIHTFNIICMNLMNRWHKLKSAYHK